MKSMTIVSGILAFVFTAGCFTVEQPDEEPLGITQLAASAAVSCEGKDNSDLGDLCVPHINHRCEATGNTYAYNTNVDGDTNVGEIAENVYQLVFGNLAATAKSDVASRATCSNQACPAVNDMDPTDSDPLGPNANPAANNTDATCEISAVTVVTETDDDPITYQACTYDAPDFADDGSPTGSPNCNTYEVGFQETDAQAQAASALFSQTDSALQGPGVAVEVNCIAVVKYQCMPGGGGVIVDPPDSNGEPPHDSGAGSNDPPGGSNPPPGSDGD